MTGHLPPNYSKHGTKFLAAEVAIDLPVAEEPVKIIKSKVIFTNDLATYTLPYMTLKNLGSKYFSNSYLRTWDVWGANSLVLKTTLFPAAIAVAA